MKVRWTRKLVATTLVAASAAALAACGGTDRPSGKSGPPIVVASFSFTDSRLLGEIYASALEAKGYPVTRKLNLGSRELIYPSLKKGELQFIPEYQGSAIAAGFGREPVKDAEGEHEQLAKLLAPSGISLLDYAGEENKDTYIVLAGLAKSKGLVSIGDLKKVDKVVLAGGPECAKRLTCFKGFTDVYRLTNASFQAVQELGPRVQQLDSGALTVIAVDSVSPLVGDPKYVALKDDLTMVPTENVVPAVSKKVLDERGPDFAAAVNAVSAKLTTEGMRELNKRVDSDGEKIADVAGDWLAGQGLA